MAKFKNDGGALLILVALLAVPVGVCYEIFFRHAQPYPPAVLVAVAVLCFSMRSVYDMLR
jgi:hypothetical protein